MTDQRTGDSNPDDPPSDRAFEARIALRRRLLYVDPSAVRDDPDAAAEAGVGKRYCPDCGLTLVSPERP